MEQPLPAERHRRIQELLRERRVVRVSVLSESMGVSGATIRRDLEALERRGLLEETEWRSRAGDAMDAVRARILGSHLQQHRREACDRESSRGHGRAG